MELKVYDRILLLNILPKEGDFQTLKIIRKLREALSFDETELEGLQFKNAGDKYIDEKGIEQVVQPGVLHWNSAADIEKEVEIGKKAHEVIALKLKELSDAKKLTDAHFNLYEKFIPDEE